MGVPVRMLSKPFIVALMGAPCSGKSTALPFLQTHLSKTFQVLCVPETATMFFTNSEGFKPWRKKELQYNIAVQRILFAHQLATEEAFCEFANLHPKKRAVVILDSCCLSSKIYLPDLAWSGLLGEHRFFSEKHLRDRYDLVIHMTTAAKCGEYKWGHGSNNSGRFHTREQAVNFDQRCIEIV